MEDIKIDEILKIKPISEESPAKKEFIKRSRKKQEKKIDTEKKEEGGDDHKIDIYA